MTTKNEIHEWLKRGKRQRATHLIVVCDTFSHDDYPVFVTRGENVRDRYDKYNGENMQRVMEVYDLRLDLEKQLAEERAFHLEDTSDAPTKNRLKFLHMRIPPEKHAVWKDAASAENRTLTNWVETHLDQVIEKRQKAAPKGKSRR